MNDPKIDNSIKTYLIAAIPLVMFISLAAIFYKQLGSETNPNDLPSVLIDKKAPAFPTEPLLGLKKNNIQIPAATKAFTNGKVTLVNVWASWCVPCRQEHPVISKFAEDNKNITLVGINYKDKNPNALRFLGALGNPYAAVSIDPNGAASIDWGVYGIPETYILDQNDTIIYKHVGPISPRILEEKLLPIINGALAKK